MRRLAVELVLAVIAVATIVVASFLIEQREMGRYTSIVSDVDGGAVAYDPERPMPEPYPWKVIRRWAGYGITRTPTFKITWPKWNIRVEAQDADDNHIAVSAVVQSGDGSTFDVPTYIADHSPGGMKWSEGYFDGPGAFWLECDCRGLHVTIEVHERQGED